MTDKRNVLKSSTEARTQKTKACRIKKCYKPLRGYGLCNGHYENCRMYGFPFPRTEGDHTVLNTIHGVEVLVDNDTGEFCLDKRLYLTKGYVAFAEKGRIYKLHRVVMGAKKGQEIDHINRDKLDNRRTNLRFCTRLENVLNRTSWNRYGLVGLSKRKGSSRYTLKKWDGSRKRHKHLGTFSSVKEAKAFVRGSHEQI